MGDDQYYQCCCPCLLARDMCEHTGGNGCCGCIGSLLCPLCLQCVLAPRIAKKSGIHEDCASASLKTCCCCTAPCYSVSVHAEYMKQKRLAQAGEDMQTGRWLMTVGDVYYESFCPCLIGRDVCMHTGASGAQGFFGMLCAPCCFFCWAGPRVAGASGIDERPPKAFVKGCMPCTSACYRRTVLSEYYWQKSRGVGVSAPKQTAMR